MGPPGREEGRTFQEEATEGKLDPVRERKVVWNDWTRGICWGLSERQVG